MIATACANPLMDASVEDDREFELTDYEGAMARWCPGCGDHSVLSSVQRLLKQEQLEPAKTVFVSGIGCSSRFPHYMKTYGFHGLHGRALPVATGVKLSRPDLHVFVVMGDGDCTSIGAGHWMHAIRYNIDMVALMLDNNIYGMTKMQTSPTTPQGFNTNTQPRGSYLPALNPIELMLGITNASFVAQTAEWSPAHMFATLEAAHRHKGFSFVRILQRCPVYTPKIFMGAVRDPGLIELLVHEDGVDAPELRKMYGRVIEHDPKDIDSARRLAQTDERIRLGIFYRDESRQRYNDIRTVPHHTVEQKISLLEEEFARHAI